MKSIAIFSLGCILMCPSLLSLSGDCINAFIGIVWGVILYQSPKFSPVIKNFWSCWWQTNMKILNVFNCL